MVILGGLISPLTSLNAHESPGLKKFLNTLENAGDEIIKSAAESLVKTCIAGKSVCRIFKSIEDDPEEAIEILEGEEDAAAAVEAGSAMAAEVCVLGGCD